MKLKLTQSKSKTIITRQMCVKSLIVFIDHYYGHSIIIIVHEIHYTKYMLLNYIHLQNNNKYNTWEYKHYMMTKPLFNYNIL